jgi:hypothetical protein
MFNRLLILTGATLLALSTLGSAGEIHQVMNRNSLVTASYTDLSNFMRLNAMSPKPKAAIRAVYKNLEANQALFNFQPGAQVSVEQHLQCGIAQISFDGGSGFIAEEDLGPALGMTEEAAASQPQEGTVE